jgi:hypothetical protein
MSILRVKKFNEDGVWKGMYLVTFSDGVLSSVPQSEYNRHYQEIQEWVEEGNTIEEAD